MQQEYVVIVRDNERELAESVRVANTLGMMPVGPLISDISRVLQVMRKVREGYVTAEGKPCDGQGNVL